MLSSTWDDVLTRAREDRLDVEGPPLTVSVNWVLVGLSSIVVVCALLGTWFWYSHQLSRQTEVFLRRAEEAQSRGDWREASAWLAKYSRDSPGQISRLCDFARTMRDSAKSRDDLSHSLRLFQRYLETYPDDVGVRSEAANILLGFDAQAAMLEANRILLSRPKHVDALRIRALALDQLASVDESPRLDLIRQMIQAYRALLAASPGEIENASRLAAICRIHADRISAQLGMTSAQLNELADKTMDSLVREDPTNVAARLARFEYRHRFDDRTSHGGFIELDDDIQAVLMMDEDNPYALYAAGAHYARVQPGDLIQKERLQVAYKHLSRAVELRPDLLRPYIVLARVSAALGNREESLSILQQATEQFPGSLELLATIADVQIDARHWEPARATIAELKQTADDSLRMDIPLDMRMEVRLRYAEAQALLARWYLADGNPQRDTTAAIGELKAIVPEKVPSANASKLFQQIGTLYASLGNWAEAAAAFERALTSAPKATVIRLHMATALAKAGRISEAIRECRKLLAVDLPRHYRRVALYDYARFVFNREAEKASSERDWNEFDRAIEALEELDSGEPRGYLLELDSVYVRNGLEARPRILESLKSLETKFARSELFLRGAIDLCLRVGRPKEAERFVERLDKLLLRPKRQGAPTREGAGHDLSVVKERQFEADLRLAIQERRFDEAFDVLRNWRTELPADMQPQLEFLRLATKLNRPDQLERLENELADIPGQGDAVWRTAHIQRLVSQAQSGDADALLQLAEFVKNWTHNDPDSASAWLALAMSSEVQGRLGNAVSAYQRLLELGYRPPNVLRRLTGTLILDNRLNEAAQVVDSLSPAEKAAPAMMPLAVHVALKQARYEDAINTAELSFQLDQRNVEARIQLAAALLKRGNDTDQTAAHDLIQMAVNAAPSDLSVLVAAVFLTITDNRPTQSQRLLTYVERTWAILSCNRCDVTAWRPFVMGRCLQLRGSLSSADSYLRRALANDDSVSRWIPAGTYMTQRILPEKHDSATVDRDPSLWSADSAAHDTLNVLTMVTESASSDTDQSLPPRLAAIVDIVKAGALANESALEHLAKLSVDDWSAPDHLLAAELYMALGKPDEAVQELKACLGRVSLQDNIARVASYALKLQRASIAQLCLDLLRDRGVANDLTAEIEVRILLSEGSVDQAVNVASRHVGQLKGEQQVLFARNVAREFAEAGRIQEGRQLLERVGRFKPFRDSLLATWISGIPGHAEEAIQLCKKSSGDPLDVAQLAVVCVQRQRVSPDVISTVRQMVDRVMLPGADLPAPFVVNLARLSEIEGHLEQSVKLCESGDSKGSRQYRREE